jgi:hypothetical protein
MTGLGELTPTRQDVRSSLLEADRSSGKSGYLSCDSTKILKNKKKTEPN